MDPITPRPDATALRVVVAEDDPDMRQLVRDVLRRDGHVIVEVEHGAALIALLGLDGTAGLPDVADLLVTDLRMPFADGLSVLRRLRNAGWHKPVVMMTAFGDRSTHADAAALGAVVLDKPFDLDDLRAVVRTLGARADAHSPVRRVETTR